MVTKPVF